MSDNDKIIHVQDISPVRDRAEWRQPTFRTLDADEAQATPSNLTDSAVLS